jgi:hypothetical protein
MCSASARSMRVTRESARKRDHVASKPAISSRNCRRVGSASGSSVSTVHGPPMASKAQRAWTELALCSAFATVELLGHRRQASTRHRSGLGDVATERFEGDGVGLGPPRWPVSKLSIAASSSVLSSKSKTSMFSAMRCALVDFGMTERPCCTPQRSRTWAGLLPCALAMFSMVGLSSELVCPLSR